MDATDVLVLGAGQAGCQVAVSLRENGFIGRVTVVGDEGVLPYQRPPLSKAYLAGGADITEMLLRPESFFAQHRIDLVVDDRAVRIDRDSRRVVLDSGRQVGYDALVLALGARPRSLPVPGGQLAGVLSLRSITDADELRHRLEMSSRIVVVGGGFIGLEFAAVARDRGHHVSVVEALPRVLTRGVSATTSMYLTGEHMKHGVRILLGSEIAAMHGSGPAGSQVGMVELDDGARLPADLVVVGIGVLPNAELAAGAGLTVRDGIVVDEYLRSDDPAIYAIGDCASFPSRQAGRRVRLESVQNAVDQARCVASGICGTTQPYARVPWFWSDQYVKLQIVGITDGHDHTVVTGDVAGGRFSVFCFRRGRLLGVESVNRTTDYVMARRLIAADPDLTPDDVTAPGFELRNHLLQTAAAAA